MGLQDPRVDAYIAKSADFARPVLQHLRAIVHTACPKVEETLKWGMPSFMYKGILCGMGAFKQHCAFYFWKGPLIVGRSSEGTVAMGQFGRITHISDLPAEKILIGYVKVAMKLKDTGVNVPVRAKRKPKLAVVVPDYLIVALRKNKKAFATFENFSSSQKREYVEWITEAKGEETRKRRLDQAIEWMKQGKQRNWKYMKR